MEPLFLTSGTLINVNVLYYDGFNTMAIYKTSLQIQCIIEANLNEESSPSQWRKQTYANADCQVLPALLRLWRTWTLIITQNDLPDFIKDHLNQSLIALI